MSSHAPIRYCLAWLTASLLAFSCAPPAAENAGSEEPSVATPEAAGPETAPNAAGELDWVRVAPSIEVPEDRRLNAGFLIVDGVYNTELTAPFDIFHHIRFHSPPGLEVFTVSPDGLPVTTFEGLRLEADYSFENAPSIDILVVPSAEHSMDTDLENEAMMSWVREVGEKASYLVSLCDGAFVLAAAGLLDGLACTTFPGDQDRFAEMFPHLDLRRGISIVHDGKAITSQGGARSFDPAMYLTDHLYGPEVTKGVGRGMVIPWPPAPGTLSAIVVPPAESP